jgi:hypothetical protein
MDLYLVRKSGKKAGPKPDARRRKTGKYDWKKHVKPKRGRRG